MDCWGYTDLKLPLQKNSIDHVPNDARYTAAWTITCNEQVMLARQLAAFSFLLSFDYQVKLMDCKMTKSTEQGNNTSFASVTCLSLKPQDYALTPTRLVVVPLMVGW